MGHRVRVAAQGCSGERLYDVKVFHMDTIRLSGDIFTAWWDIFVLKWDTREAILASGGRSIFDSVERALAANWFESNYLPEGNSRCGTDS